jgi:hypothetical protein
VEQRAVGRAAGLHAGERRSGVVEPSLLHERPAEDVGNDPEEARGCAPALERLACLEGFGDRVREVSPTDEGDRTKDLGEGDVEHGALATSLGEQRVVDRDRLVFVRDRQHVARDHPGAYGRLSRERGPGREHATGEVDDDGSRHVGAGVVVGHQRKQPPLGGAEVCRQAAGALESPKRLWVKPALEERVADESRLEKARDLLVGSAELVKRLLEDRRGILGPEEEEQAADQEGRSGPGDRVGEQIMRLAEMLDGRLAAYQRLG